MKIFFFTLIFLLPFSRVDAKIVRGSNFYHEWTGTPNADPNNTSRPKSISRNKLRLVAPLDRSFFGGLLAARYELYGEKYTQFDSSEDRKVSMLGFTYIPHFDEGPPTWFVTYGFYSDFVQAPMHETTVGFNLRNTPFYFPLTDAASVDLFLAFYARRFLNTNRWQTLRDTSKLAKNDNPMETDVPTNFFVGRVSDDQKWIAEINAYVHTINYPWSEQAAESGWIDGYTTNYNFGVKRKIYHVVYGTLYAGVQAARYWYTTKQDSDVFEQRTEFAPIVMMGVETLFSIK